MLSSCKIPSQIKQTGNSTVCTEESPCLLQWFDIRDVGPPHPLLPDAGRSLLAIVSLEAVRNSKIDALFNSQRMVIRRTQGYSQVMLPGPDIIRQRELDLRQIISEVLC